MLKKEKSRNINQITKQQHQKRKLTKKLKTMKTEISKFEIYDNNTKIKTQKTTKTEMRTFIIKWRLTSKSGIFKKNTKINNNRNENTHN